jgi:glucose/mannose transport system permease protein
MTPQLALTPALVITLVGFVGSICWTIYMSFTRSRRFPDYAIDPDWFGQYHRLFTNPAWTTALSNLVVLALGSALAIVFGFVLAAMIEREKRGEGFFRTVFLYPLAISLIVTGLVWRWMFNPSLGIEAFLRQNGFPGAEFNWLARPETAMYAIILASIWHGLGFYMALMLAGLKSINTEISTGRDHGARTCGKNLIAFLCTDVHAGVNHVRTEEYAAVAVFGKRPVDVVRGDGTGEVEVIVSRNCPRHGIKRRTPS